MNELLETESLGDMELLKLPPLGMDADAILANAIHYHRRMLGRRTLRTHEHFLYQALVHATRDRLTERWIETRTALERSRGKRACYISLEFLMGRLLRNALLNLGTTGQTTEAMERLGVDLEDIHEQEQDAGLGNGGLGRLAACFLDSCATLGLPVTGYGIRYRFGMFHQRLQDGHQIEEPDVWLREGYPWEIERSERSRTVKFGGRVERFRDSQGNLHLDWVDTHDVLAVPFDLPIPGYRNEVVNTLRLWSAAATDEFDLEEFNAGSYADAVAAKNEAENITMVLYPNAETENGRELRLRQQYFLASASLQDILQAWKQLNDGGLNGFEDKHCFQLNDTHPAIAVPELMRLLMDENGYSWDEAWKVTTTTMAYTNHTLLPEALETWPVAMFENLLPRILEIIYEINARFLSEVGRRWPGDKDQLSRMSLIEEGAEKKVRMAYLAIVGSFSVNGVAELHSRLLKQGLFNDFAQLWPEKFNNKTNGVTQRRWLAACNPALATLISDRIGEDWVTDLDQLERLMPLAADNDFQQQWQEVKQHNKQRLAADIQAKTGLGVDTSMIFDVQVKRIHEYKRQLLNLLHVIHLYDRIQRGDGDDLPPRAVIIGGKAAPGYDMAKKVIKLINNVAAVINIDPAMKGRLQLVFYPDYNVSAMELISPAADLSEQVSTAGKEASGTGNMKFMMNGAVTIGTLDGANVEILEAVGEENFFLFGLTVDEIAARKESYDPQSIINEDRDFRRVMRLLDNGHFNQFEPCIFDDVIAAIRNPDDLWMTAADFREYVDAQEAAGAAYQDQASWTRMSILNSAKSGRFSTDRTMQDYNRDIWRLDKIKLATK